MRISVVINDALMAQADSFNAVTSKPFVGLGVAQVRGDLDEMREGK